jgi:hypothetical protein
MYESITSIISNCVPNIYDNYNKLCNELYDINYDFYVKIVNYINDTNDSNATSNTHNQYNNIYRNSNFDINYFIKLQLIVYYAITTFVGIILIKYYLNMNDTVKYTKIYNATKSDNNSDDKQDNKPDTKTDYVNDIKKNDVINNKPYEKKLYLYSLIEIMRNNDDIISKLKVNTNYIAILRVKLKNYVQMKNTKYELRSKYKKNDKNNNNDTDFMTKDMYMIMGFNFNNQHTSFANILVGFINHLNQISDDKYKNDDFLIVAIGSVSNTYGFINGIKNTNYELFNLIDVIFNLNNDNFIKYTLTLPIQNINNMVLDIFNDTVFISKQYSIDKNNYERWNGYLLNDIDEW